MKLDTGFGRGTRRRFLRGLGCGAAWLAAPAAVCSETERARPNIIFLLTDDQRAGTLGVDGHPVIETPNLDRLAREGVRFTQAFVAEPTCAPSRVSFLTGQYERVHRIGFSSRDKMSEKQWETTYPALLRRANYYTGFIGKFGVQNYTFRGRTHEKFDFWMAHDGWARFWARGRKDLAVYADCREEIVTPMMGECMDRFLDSCPEGKPFCLSVSFSAPHGSISGSMLPGESGQTRMTHPANTHPKLEEHPIYGNRYRDRGVRIPEATSTDPRKHIPASVMNPKGGRNRTYSYAYTKPTCLEHHYRYYQLITGIDAAVGRLRGSLRRRGLSDNTVIIFSSDHGLLMGEYGMGGKGLLYDLTARVPLVVYDPQLPGGRRGERIGELVSSIDVAPTILEYAGVERPQSVDGESLIGLMRGDPVKWRRELFLENLFTGRDTPLSEGVRTKRWKYIRYFKAPDPYRESDLHFAGRTPVFEQLFDLEADPRETRNLVAASQHAETLARLRKSCRETSDRMIARRKAYKAQLE